MNPVILPSLNHHFSVFSFPILSLSLSLSIDIIPNQQQIYSQAHNYCALSKTQNAKNNFAFKIDGNNECGISQVKKIAKETGKSGGVCNIEFH